MHRHSPGRAFYDHKRDEDIQCGRLNPEHRHFGTATPGPPTTIRPIPTAVDGPLQRADNEVENPLDEQRGIDLTRVPDRRARLGR
jgi:hypothetical protein